METKNSQITKQTGRGCWKDKSEVYNKKNRFAVNLLKPQNVYSI